MERSRLTFSALIYLFLFIQKISGSEIEKKVKPGDNITLSCDRPISQGYSIVWIRNCSHEHQPSLILNPWTMFQDKFKRFSFPKNPNINSYDLHITNITVSDLGLYYCAELERNVKYVDKITYKSDLYHYGNQRTRLSVIDTSCPGPVTTVSPPVSDCFICWTLFFSVCPICVLFCLICVYCLCKKTDHRSGHEEMPTSKNTFQGDFEVCYASVDLTARRSKGFQKKQPQSSDFSVYAPVKTDSRV